MEISRRNFIKGVPGVMAGALLPGKKASDKIEISRLKELVKKENQGTVLYVCDNYKGSIKEERISILKPMGESLLVGFINSIGGGDEGTHYRMICDMHLDKTFKMNTTGLNKIKGIKDRCTMAIKFQDGAVCKTVGMLIDYEFTKVGKPYKGIWLEISLAIFDEELTTYRDG